MHYNSILNAPPTTVFSSSFKCYHGLVLYETNVLDLPQFSQSQVLKINLSRDYIYRQLYNIFFLLKGLTLVAVRLIFGRNISVLVS